MLKGLGLAAPTRIRKPHFFTKNKQDLNYSRRIPAYRSPRITINVSGTHYETYEETLANYPETLLGSPVRRKPYYNSVAGEYFFQRDKYLFDAILFYYQSRGILAKPDGVREDIFLQEVDFYGIGDDTIVNEEPEPENEEIELPENPLKRKLWLWFEYPRSSLIARGLALWSVLIIAISTISFCIETLPSLRIEKTHEIDIYSAVAEIETVLRRFNTTVGNRTMVSAINTTIRTNVTTKNTEVIVENVIDYWFILESFCVVWFTFEYIIRLVSGPNALHFFRSTMGILDIVAVVPFYITLALQQSTVEVRSFAVVRAMRLFRVLRVFKLSRYSNALKLLVKTLYSSSEQLRTLFFCFMVVVVLFSSAIYYAESRTTIPSIPFAFWWSIITMTSVGYGDVVPITLAGKLVGSFCAMSGLILFCLPTPVLVSNFIKYYLASGTDNRKKIFAENLKEIFLRKNRQ